MRCALVLFLCVLQGCATVGTIPAHLMTCPSEPVPGDIRTESQFVDWTESVRLAGAACRRNLRAIERIETGK